MKIPEEGEPLFRGFSPRSVKFLSQVRVRDSREWFESNREVYEEHLLSPFRALVIELGKTMIKIDRKFEMRPAINRTISRIFRDTRFSKDKSIFRDSMWLTFKRPGPGWTGAPGYFFELSTEGYSFGMGYYSASRSTMDHFRASIDRDPKGFLATVSFLKKGGRFTLEGEEYKRPIKNPHPPKMQKWYQKKSFYLLCSREHDDILFSSALAGELSSAFSETARLYRYLRDISDMKDGGGA